MRRIACSFNQLRRGSNIVECRQKPCVLARTAVTVAKKTTDKLQADASSKYKELNFGSHVAAQQVRNYVPTTHLPKCWNCKELADRKEHMICTACGHLQDVNMEINYFDLLKFPKTFAMETQALTKRFRQLQTLVHPDKFSNKSTREQTNSADWSSLINKAYKTLSVPIERGQYMLKLQGQQIPEDNSALDKEFLMAMMERNEEVEDADTSDELKQLNAQIIAELNDKVEVLNENFQANALEAAKSTLVQMKYLLSIQNSIKNKLQSLMGS